METDFESEGLLEGIDGDAREARRELLEQLAGAGVGLEELRRATEEGRLPLLPLERLLGSHDRHSFEEIAQQTWRQGRIERERFFYDPAGVVVPSDVREVA